MAPLAGSAWLGRSLQQTAQTAQDRRLRSIFFESLRLSQGRVNVLTFSMQSHLSGSDAKAYLSDRAREFNATFDVDDSGGLTYCFDLGDYPAALSGVEVTYSVLIMAIPDIHRRQVIRVLQKLTGLSWSDVKALAKETPALVKTKLSLPLAQEFRSRLEAVGATVSIVVD
jgi:ribosomal protein L7/L12